MNISLIGFMGSGKSTIANNMAIDKGLKLVSIDKEIVKEQSLSIAQIFQEYGEDYFRQLETKKLLEVLQLDNQIIDCGGGLAIYNSNILKDRTYVIYIYADFDIIWERLRNDKQRPLLKDKSKDDIYKLYKERDIIYRRICKEIITNNKI